MARGIAQLQGSPTTPAIVIGFEANGLGVARALAEERIPVIAIGGSDWNPSWYTRCARRIIKCRDWTAECFLETLLTLAKELSEPAPLLITKDEPVLWVSSHRDELSKYFRFALPTDETVQLLMSKVQFEPFARQQGWPLPASWSVNTRAQLEAYTDSITYPCILKVAVKNLDFRRNSPSKAFKLDDRQSLFNTYDMVRQWEPDVIIQEWIPGGDDRITYCLGYWNTAGKPTALFAGRKLRQWPPECGGTAIAAPAPDDWAERVTALTTTIMRTVGYRGLGSVEFKMRSDGSPVIIEPTVGRTNYQNEVAVINGVNIPAAAYYDLVGQSAKAEQWLHRHRKSGAVKLIDDEGDRSAARLYMQSRTLTRKEWRQSRSGPRRFMLFRPEDPMPSAMAILRRAAMAAKRRLGKVIPAFVIDA